MVVMFNDLTTGNFLAEIYTTLRQGKIYWVKSFIETADYIVYGEGVSFIRFGIQALVISSFSPVPDYSYI
jgi:hypothetical protein